MGAERPDLQQAVQLAMEKYWTGVWKDQKKADVEQGEARGDDDYVQKAKDKFDKNMAVLRKS